MCVRESKRWWEDGGYKFSMKSIRHNLMTLELNLSVLAILSVLLIPAVHSQTAKLLSLKKIVTTVTQRLLLL